MIRAHGLTKRFGDVFAVADVTFEVEPGEVFGLLGPNGAGKTTTIRMLSALVAPTRGAAWVNGYEIGKSDDAIRASIGILTETPGLYTRLSAVQNLELFAKLHGLDEVDRRLKHYLSLLGLWDRRHEPAGSFSKGMRQKLAIARALLHEPPVLFLDEPTAALDPEAARTVREFIADLRGKGRTILLCTHNLDEADRLCDRIAILRQKIVRVDTPQALRQRLYGRRTLVRLRHATPALASVASALPFVRSVSVDANSLRVELDEPEKHNPRLVRALVEAGAEIQLVEEEAHSLEKVYFDVLDAAATKGEAT